MENISKLVSAYLEEEKTTLIDELLLQAINKLNLDLPNEHITKHKEMLNILLHQVSKSLNFDELKTQETNLDYDIHNFFYENGIILNDTVEIISSFRLSLINEIEKNDFIEKATPKEISQLYKKIIFIFDEAIRDTTQDFKLQSQKAIEIIEKEIMELSAPIVPIKDKVAVLPLIGDFNETRAMYISTEVIPKIAQLDIELLVIDFSGMLVFDTFVAHHFFQLKDTLKLLGIESVVTGVRPSLAQTAVQLGLNLNDIQAYNNVKDFLEVLNKQKNKINQ